MKKAMWFGLLICFSVLMGATATAQTKMMFVTGPSTGGWYPTGAALGEIIMNNVPGLNLTVTEGGGVGNIRDLNANKAQLGYTFSDVFAEALEKRGTFAKENITQASGFLSLYVSYLQTAVHDNSPIRSYGDLKGKRIAPGRKNWSGEILAQRVLEAYGLSYDIIKAGGGGINFVGFSEMTDLMRDKHLDLCLGVTAAPSSFLQDLQTTHKIRFIPIDKQQADLIAAKYPGYYYVDMPANTYKDQPQPVKTLGSYTIVLVRKDMPVDTVYNMAKAVITNLDKFRESHPTVRTMTKENAIQGLKREDMHPGVVKYFKEIGVIK